MISYATGTGTRRNMEAMKAHGWRLLVNALEPRLPPKGWRYALDNGAWSAFTRKQPFDDEAFVRALERFGAAADWTVCPDIVEGGVESLSHSAELTFSANGDCVWIIDYAEIAKLWEEKCAHLDHCNLNDFISPSTTENLVLYIRDLIRGKLGMSLERGPWLMVKLVGVRVYESDTTFAEWKAE